MRKEGLTITEFLIIIALIGILAAILLPALATAPTHRRHGQPCVNNLKQLGLVLGLYTSENEGMFPPIDDTKNNFMFDGDILYPEYLTDASILACASDKETDYEANFRLRSTDNHPGFSEGTVHPDCMTDMSYVYLGWLVTSDEEAEAFFEAYDTLSLEGRDADIVVEDGKGNGGSSVIHRLEKDAEKFLTGSSKDASEIPIMWDKPSTNPVNFSHVSGSGTGGNVLYLDGHVEFVHYPGKFPMSETMARLLDERPRKAIPDCDE